MASILSLALLPLVVDAFAVPWNPKQKNTYAFKKQTIKGFQDPSPDVLVESYSTIAPAEGVASRSSIFLQNMRKSKNKKFAGSHPLLARQTQSGVGQLTALDGVEYLVDIKLGGQDLKVILDTGSSDTWVPIENYTCTDANDKQVSQATCDFGPLYKGTVDKPVENQFFKIAYGDGEFATGKFGLNDVTIAGITVPQQKVALVDRAYWLGDKVSSGLIGLAYSAITSAFTGTNPKASASRVPYDPIFTTMYKQNLSAPTFSLALQRNSGGYIAFGGLPPVTIGQEFGSSKIELLQGQSGGAPAGLTFYTITPDAWSFTGAASKQSSQYIVDSGTTLLYAEPSVAKAINSLFSPKATTQQGTYVVSCTAKVPDIGITIGGKTFKIDAKDMLLQDPSGLCVSGVQDGGTGPYILGDVFMNNVVSVFDVGAGEMRFAQHTY